MDLLIRQARDILVCAYHGNLENFVRAYLSPAAALLAEVKSVVSETVSYFLLLLIRVAGCVKTCEYNAHYKYYRVERIELQVNFVRWQEQLN